MAGFTPADWLLLARNVAISPVMLVMIAATPVSVAPSGMVMIDSES